jgi:hypothetical protein
MSDQGRTQELLLLGQIHGLVQALKDGQDLSNTRIADLEKKVDTRFDGIDSRLRNVEQKAAVMGAVSGGAMAIGTALIIEGIKHWLGRGGPTP